MNRIRSVGLSLFTLAALAACGGEDAGANASADAAGAVSGDIQIDGSSTVFPVTEAVAEEFMAETGGDVRVAVAMSGTGGGFKRFCAGETAISNASRPIKESEAEACRANGIEPIEIPVAWDGMAVVVNPSNTFVQCLKVEELKRIWEPGSTVKTWADIRPEWPAEPIKLYGPGTNSGTFDYFTEEVVGEAGASRADYTASEDDNVLVQGIAGDQQSLGYFGYAYYVENRGKVKAVGVDAGKGCVEPTPETIETGTYAPLSRPLTIYVAKKELARPEVRRFVDFYLESAPTLSQEVGYVPLSGDRYAAVKQELERAANAPS